jgi:PepB aminopeptidase
MSEQMSVTISNQPAAAQWGDKAIISFSENGVTIHVESGHELGAVQRAARKLDGQGIKSVVLQGEGWGLEEVWAFYQGYRSPKKTNSVQWAPLAEAEQAELEARIKVSDWVRDIINKPAEEVAPRQLATMAGEFIKSLAPEKVTYRIVKDKDL